MGQDCKTLFIVDDTPDNVRLLANLLSAHGYRIRKALDANFALKSIEQSPPDLILLDVNMPIMNGYEMCAQLKSNPDTQEIPIIFISALDNVLDKVKAFNLGGADYITKPFQMEEVLARIEHQLLLLQQKHQLRAEIQERKRAEQSLEVSLRVVSHDLRNPVLGLSMVLNNYLKRADPNQTELSLPRQTLEQMARSCERQLALINSLVESQHWEQQGVPLVLRRLDLSTLVRDFAQEWSLGLGEQEVTLSLNLGENLPLFMGDANFIWRVLENLLANSLKYNPLPRSQPLNITITVTALDQTLTCRVTDNGVGVDLAIADRVFERYQRGDRDNNPLGLGLGLYVCKLIVEAHGGKIGLNTAVSKGAEIYFTLPLEKVPA
ncbi:hybrid sensor histidine kinase/response regulator [Synechocystis salina]|uniref:histidine kinase n=1 Tax=Synechocystis salina LEGE 00031 TaxID=1828736 RepID=A0ABR9VSJ3_9SYNC|nr:hybrid sensor histidine kinase/response regulator [Synechocystis salina]MBE9240844.1 hybrid sensor histidine kinase/response regulator [Synechocystis salina LEGE 00041]MBE9254304.1 hybrid sensor histidine kinase/response regulator [Synechocystis salina LEGE 00031]